MRRRRPLGILQTFEGRQFLRPPSVIAARAPAAFHSLSLVALECASAAAQCSSLLIGAAAMKPEVPADWLRIQDVTGLAGLCTAGQPSGSAVGSLSHLKAITRLPLGKSTGVARWTIRSATSSLSIGSWRQR
jgi:hypothetical protein